LRAEHPGAAASLDEGLEETPTVMAMKLPRGLERVMSTTNVIENLIGSTRELSARVKQWRDGEMIVRSTATAVREASTKFRRIAGHANMPKLVRALRDQRRRRRRRIGWRQRHRQRRQSDDLRRARLQLRRRD
jgi:hypothetical protein